MDYRRIVVDYPLSPRVEDALIRLAQLEIARGNYEGALKHLNRLAAEHPESPARARAGYWMARAMFDKNDIQGGCAALADALARTTENDAELRNQLTYLNQRCAGVVLAGPAPLTAAPSPPNLPVTQTARDSASPPAVATVSTQPIATSPRDSTSKPSPVASPRDSASIGQVRPAASPPVKPREVPPGVIEPAASVPSGNAGASAAGSRVYSVQVAAYNVKSQADAMVARLRKNGYEARVDGTSAPFRVRIGRYATQAQAGAVQRSLKAKQIAGFVVQAETR